MSRTDVAHRIGFKHVLTVKGHSFPISSVVWSPDGTRLATASYDQTIRIWAAPQGQPIQTLAWGSGWANNIAWAPDGQTLAGAGISGLKIWDSSSGKVLNHYEFEMGRQSFNSISWSPDGEYFAAGSKYSGVYLWKSSTKTVRKLAMSPGDSVRNVSWSPDGRVIAYAAGDHNIYLWDVDEDKPLNPLVDVDTRVQYVTWSKGGELLACGCEDATVRIWDYQRGLQTSILEGHTGAVSCLSFSSNGSMLAARGSDGAVGIWRTDTWEVISSFQPTVIRPATYESSLFIDHVGLNFSPVGSLLADLSETGSEILIWHLDFDAIARSSHPDTIHYTNAKVVLVGDTGVGKSGLALALTRQPFTPTDSTHGRRVWILDSEQVILESGTKETREILLWDLAGQPGYRLIHQLHLNDVVVALVVFDGRNEQDPFAGVRHWNRAVYQAQSLQGSGAYPVKKILVAARMDRGGVGVSRARLENVLLELKFDKYFVTSAKENVNIDQLAQAIHDAIAWDLLPRVSSTTLFQSIRDFIVAEKDGKRCLSTEDDLFRAYTLSTEVVYNGSDLRQQFEKCIGRMESRGLIRRLSFGGLVLLSPELLDSYASALVSSVKNEPDGLGSIAEDRVLSCMFNMPDSERVHDREQEKLLLIAMVEDLIRHELSLREHSDEGPYLIFPSQSTREHPDLLNIKGQAVVLEFEGAIYNIYATLAVRLSHSGMFKQHELWQNAVTFRSFSGQCGIFLHLQREGHGQLTLFFERSVAEDTRKHFEEFVKAHLRRRALPGSIVQRYLVTCPYCGVMFTDEQIERRLRLNLKNILCSVCENRVYVDPDYGERPLSEEPVLADPNQEKAVARMVQHADELRELDVIATTIQGKREVGSYDVFMCYNKEDKEAVIAMGLGLQQKGILPWLDEWEIRPGEPWQDTLDKHLGSIRVAAVFVGESGIGPWQHVELSVLIDRMVNRGCQVIPVLLKGAVNRPDLPVFLRALQWVDFNLATPDPMANLVWGITGKRED